MLLAIYRVVLPLIVYVYHKAFGIGTQQTFLN